MELRLMSASNLHHALRTHMHSKHRLGNANTEAKKEKRKSYVGKESSPYINQGKGDTLAQRA
eukprot:1021182-Pelagomonas_calceolata.AAC.1